MFSHCNLLLPYDIAIEDKATQINIPYFFILLAHNKCKHVQVFADHETSISPIHVPRKWIWNLPRRLVYFGTSVTSIVRGSELMHLY